MENVFDTRRKKMIISALCILLVVANTLIIVFTIGSETSIKLLQTTTEVLSQWNVILKLNLMCVFYIYFVVKIIFYL